ncbi:hypothetical protein SADUNF_Sadunf11G0008300 [Salix dunnii]|uniref:GAG-pre-integrase domain-containing protein n=1 Tax=Salix dunnii TaxID=1413687 RepID=A0A835MSR7_9ROSI|nr:hypothetical protein SADUNF_Sadunf11G0008300 [Salix dunnii]
MAFYGQYQQRYQKPGYQGNKQIFTSTGRGFQAQQSKDQNLGYSPKAASNQFPVKCEFTNIDFFVKERQTGQIVIAGRRKGDLYMISNSPELYFSHRFKPGSTTIWHQRLGHPQFSTLQLLKNKGMIDVTGNTKLEQTCDSCQLGKLSRLPFSHSKHFSSETESQTSTPPCSNPISVIPLLISDFSTLTDPSSHQHDNQQPRTPPISNTSVPEQSLNIPHNNFENSLPSEHS